MSLPVVVSNQSAAADRGLAFGREHSDAVRVTVNAYDRLLGTVGWIRSELLLQGQCVGEYLAQRWPAVLEEIEGIAHGAEQPPELLLALNARTELLAGAGARECSVVGVEAAVTDNGSTILAQNWDWHPDLREAWVLWHIAPGDGSRWLCTLTEAGLVGKIGLNSRGLGCATNILGSTADGGVGGLPILVAARLMLEHCNTIDDAVALLRAERFTGSTCFNLGCGGPDDGMAAIEVSPGAVTRIDPGPDGWCLHTNHFLRAPGSGKDYYLDDWPDTRERLSDLQTAARQLPRPNVDGLTAALRSHQGGAISVCCHDEDNPDYSHRQCTLASVVMDLTQRRLFVADGQPCQAPYKEVPGLTQPAGAPEAW